MENVLALRLVSPIRKKNALLVDAALVVGGSLFVSLMAQLAVYLPFSPVPVTMQTFAVLLIGMAYGSRLGALTLLVYLLEGASGLPFFAGGLSGPAVLIGPTGGYLIGFIAAAWLTGWLAERGLDRKVWSTALAFAAGSIVIYLFGVLWLSRIVGFSQALQAGVLPFLIGDILKAALAGAGLPAAHALVNRQNRA